MINVMYVKSFVILSVKLHCNLKCKYLDIICTVLWYDVVVALSSAAYKLIITKYYYKYRHVRKLLKTKNWNLTQVKIILQMIVIIVFWYWRIILLTDTINKLLGIYEKRNKFLTWIPWTVIIVKREEIFPPCSQHQWKYGDWMVNY